MRLFLILLLIIIQSKDIQAQNLEELKKNKDISFIAETYFYYDLHREYYDSPYQIASIGNWKTQIIKRSTPNPEAPEIVSIYHILMDAAKMSKLKLYKDADLKVEFNKKEKLAFFNRKRTSLVKAASDDREEQIKSEIRELNGDDVKGLKIRQLVYYNKKELVYQTIPIAAGLMILKDESYKLDYYEKRDTALYWIPLKIGEDLPDWSDPNITFGVHSLRTLRLRMKIPQEPSGISKLYAGEVSQLKKEQSFGETAEHLLKEIRNQAEQQKVFMSYSDTLMELEQVKEVGICHEEVFAIDPETFEENIQTVTSETPVEEIKGIRFVQDFYWDETNKILKVYTIAMAPMLDTFDDNGNFLINRPMFYRVLDQLKQE